MLIANISDITIIAIKNVNYCCIIHSISKSELENSVLEDRGYIYKKNIILISGLLKTVF